MNILMAESKEPLSETIHTIMNDMPSSNMVREVSHYHDFLHYLQTMNPEIVVIDISDDRDEGIDLILRAKQHNPDAIIIVLSESINENIRELCKSTGASFYFNKWIELRRFVQCIVFLTRFNDATNSISYSNQNTGERANWIQ